MKKILTILTVLFCFNTLNAAITDLQTEVNGTNVEFYWQGDTSLTAIYEVGIFETSAYSYVSYVGAYPSSFDAGNGWFGCTTDIILKYGRNWSDYAGTVNESYFPKDAWDASVDSLTSGLTLKPGMYIVYVEGYDSNYSTTTEEMNYAFVEIKDPSQDNEIIIVDKQINKFVNNKGQLMIFSNGSFYDIMGRKIQ